MNETQKNKGLSRRDFLKIGGLAGAGLGVAGVAGAGYVAGKDTDSYTGWERYTHGDGQFFNRKPFFVDHPTYEVVGETQRMHTVEDIFSRNRLLRRTMRPGKGGGKPQWTREMGVESLPEPLKSYYTKNPQSFVEFWKTIEASEKQRENWEKYKFQFAIADAWSHANSSSLRGRDGRGAFPAEPDGAPEESDFKNILEEPLSFKSKDHASELIKEVAHNFGATLVGITKLNQDWVMQGRLRGVGYNDFEVPEHWQYAIVVAVPHEWDTMYANPVYGSSYDAYAQLRQIGGKLEVFIRDLGYPSRAQVPPVSYDVMVPPMAVDAGLGEQGRHGFLVTPELGSNTRLAAVLTNISMTVDKPIDVGIHDFCNKCKICAEQCPSNAIKSDDAPQTVVNGYKRWRVDHDACFRIWNTVATSHPRGCRVCIAVCPYSRKNNWLHTISREVDARDKTGLVANGLLAMQYTFFEYPEAKDYLPPPDGKNATYNEPPDWLKSEKWFDEPETT